MALPLAYPRLPAGSPSPGYRLWRMKLHRLLARYDAWGERLQFELDAAAGGAVT